MKQARYFHSDPIATSNRQLSKPVVISRARRMPRCRQPSHAGSWYERNSEKLSQQVDGWLAKAHPAEGSAARAIIAP
jgi:hypothetical protein